MKPLVILLKQSVIDSWAPIEAVDMRNGNELYEIMVARQVFRVKAEMVARFGLVAALVVPRGGHIRLAAEDGLDRIVGELSVCFPLCGAAFVIKRF